MVRRETGRVVPSPAGPTATVRCGAASRTRAGQVPAGAPSSPTATVTCGAASRTPAGQLPAGDPSGPAATERCAAARRAAAGPLQVRRHVRSRLKAMVRTDPGHSVPTSPGRAVRGEAACGVLSGATPRRVRSTPAHPERRALSGAIRRRVRPGPAPAKTTPAARRAATSAPPHHVPPRLVATGREEAEHHAIPGPAEEMQAAPARPSGR